MKIAKKIGLALGILFVAIQFFKPTENKSKENHLSVFILETNPSKEVLEVLKTSCLDCHSNHTVYPWYNTISPVNYWLDHHIEEGKDELNFSDWASYSKKKKDHKLEELIEEIEENKMPLNKFTWTHKEAVLNSEQKELLYAWANKTRLLYQLGDLPQ